MINFKIILIGGLAMYVTQFVLSFVTGSYIHEGTLDPLYRETAQFWRPELNQEPPDMAALMPRWISTGIVTTLIFAAIYDHIRSAFSGTTWLKGLKFGVVLGLISTSYNAGWSGVFNLPETIWIWWLIEGFLYAMAGGIVLGLIAEKLAPETG